MKIMKKFFGPDGRRRMREKGRGEPGPVGKRFGKTDLDRVGFFHDPSPAPFDEYRSPSEFREGVRKGRQMLAGPRSELFEKKFLRIFDGEALAVPWRKETEEKLRGRRPKIGGRMLPPSPSKKHSTPGDWHGCFEKPTYFSPLLKDEAAARRKARPEPPNAKIKPNPLGGPGYADICLNPFPSYSHEPYEPVVASGKPLAGRFLTASVPREYFTEDPYRDETPGPTYVRPLEAAPGIVATGRFYVPFPKRPAGSHAGCFDKFPEYSAEPYEETRAKIASEGRFIAGGPPARSKYTCSIVERITEVSCNANNYLEYKERAYAPFGY
ncbi:hypothetical protein KM043_005225 [Ampulex compressa]|nr:hypothetical protein KM043_005225 [Ampulex compressa]